MSYVPKVNSARIIDGAVASADYADDSVTGAKLGSPAYVQAYRNAGLSLSDAVFTVVDLTSEQADSDGFHSTGTNPSRLIVPTGLGGIYAFVGQMSYQNTSGAGGRQINIRKNAAGSNSGGTSVAVAGVPAMTSNNTTINACGLVPLADADYIEMFGYQSSGGALSIVAGITTVYLHMWRIGS